MSRPLKPLSSDPRINARRKKSREWNRQHPDRIRERALRHHFGISSAEYADMLRKQDGVCAICHRTGVGNGRRWLDVDHCHSTGKVRGLLCRSCNLAVGYMQDNGDRLRAAAQYLDDVN